MSEEAESEVEGKVEPDTTHEVWRKLTRAFASWKFFPINPRDFWIASSRMGNDFISRSRKLTYWEKGEAIIAEVSDFNLQRLKVWAEINRRQSENFFRVMLVIYITIPITAALVLGQLYPNEWAAFGVSLRGLATMFGIYTFALLVLFAGHWKAREIDDFLQLALAERGIFTSSGEGGEEVRLPEA